MIPTISMPCGLSGRFLSSSCIGVRVIRNAIAPAVNAYFWYSVFSLHLYWFRSLLVAVISIVPRIIMSGGWGIMCGPAMNRVNRPADIMYPAMASFVGFGGCCFPVFPVFGGIFHAMIMRLRIVIAVIMMWIGAGL